MLSERAFEGTPKDKLYLYYRQNGLWPLEVGGRDPKNALDFFAPYCPEWQVSPDYPPTLLLHGDQDTDVPYAQSVQMARALHRVDVEHQFITIPGGGHGFDGAWDEPVVRKAFDAVIAFLDRHVARGGRS